LPADLASTWMLTVMLSVKGYIALQAWRVSTGSGVSGGDFALMMPKRVIATRLQVASIVGVDRGHSVFLDHATGIVVGLSSPSADAGNRHAERHHRAEGRNPTSRSQG